MLMVSTISSLLKKIMGLYPARERQSGIVKNATFLAAASILISFYTFNSRIYIA